MMLKKLKDPEAEGDLEKSRISAGGDDPILLIEKENDDLRQQIHFMQRREKDVVTKVTSLEYENDIMQGKSNSMDNQIMNYGRRLEELSKQIDELNAIVRIKDTEMMDMTSEMHNMRMQNESMRKEMVFRK